MLGPLALGHPYRVGGSAGDVMRAWVKQSLVIIGFIISKLHDCYISYIFVLDKRNTAWLRDTVRQTSRGKSAAAGRTTGPPRPLTSRGTSAWPYRVTTQYSYYISCLFICINTHRHEKNGWHFADDIFICVFLNYFLFCILMIICLKFAPKVPIDSSQHWFR